MTDGFDLLPASMQKLARVLGMEAVADLARVHGDCTVYIPRRDFARSKLARTIGAANVETLSKVIGYGHWQVPKCRMFLAARVLREIDEKRPIRTPHGRAAWMVNVSRSSIRRLRRKARGAATS